MSRFNAVKTNEPLWKTRCNALRHVRQDAEADDDSEGPDDGKDDGDGKDVYLSFLPVIQ
jgi:hypothetical protein